MSRVSKGAKELALKIKRGGNVVTQERKSREKQGGSRKAGTEKPDLYRPFLPHVVTINGFQVLLSSITCLPSYPRENVFALLFPHPVYMPHPISKWPTRPRSHSLYPGYKSGLRTPPFKVGSPLNWPAVLTASPTLIRFILFSFCLMSGNSFPTCARTTFLVACTGNLESHPHLLTSPFS